MKIRRPGLQPWAHDRCLRDLGLVSYLPSAPGFQPVDVDAGLIHLPFHSAPETLSFVIGSEGFKQSPVPDVHPEEMVPSLSDQKGL